MTPDELSRAVDLLSSHREIEQAIYRMGYHLEAGDFDAVGELLAHASRCPHRTVGHEFTVAQQVPGEPFALLVAGRYEDEWGACHGRWRWSDRYVVAQYHNDLARHMHSGTQPYN